MTLLYAELRVSDGGRRVKGSVAILAWDFGVNKSTVFATYGRIRHGEDGLSEASHIQ